LVQPVKLAVLLLGIGGRIIYTRGAPMTGRPGRADKRGGRWEQEHGARRKGEGEPTRREEIARLRISGVETRPKKKKTKNTPALVVV